MGVIKGLESFVSAFKESEVNTGKDAQPGVHAPFWFWGCEAFAKKKKERQTPDAAPKVQDVRPVKQDPELPQPEDPDAQVQKMLIEHPTMPAAAMVQALKSKGIELKQADSATSQAPLLRAKESETLIPVRARFLESWKDNGVGPTRFKVALIQEGMGSLRDAFYYTRKALESGIVAFEGKKCFADHPSRSDEEDRPERSVRDIVGHFENAHLEEREDGGAMLCADLVMLPDPSFEWARALVRHSLEYSKKYDGQDFIGLSINASGDAKQIEMEKFIKEGNVPAEAKPKLLKALEEGITTVRVVDEIADAVSTDLVTEAGARGRVLELLESERKETMAKKMKQAEDKVKKSEAEMKQEEAKQVEGEEAKQAEEPVGQEDHEDIEKDKALILDMIKKHMGKDAEGMEAEAEAAACEAYQAHREMGKAHEEAGLHAAEAMKLAKHMAMKQAEVVEAEGEEEKEEEEEEEVKESAVKLTARIAFLERELKGYKLAAALDKKLAESKLGRAETDKLRALIGEPKSEAHIAETIKVFKEAFSMAGGSESIKPSFASLFITGAEKQEETQKAKVSFSECVKF